MIFFQNIIDHIPFYHKNIKSLLISIIKNSQLPSSSISISIKDLKTGNIIFEHNQKMLMPPASVLKIITLPAAIEILGANYKFSTSLYSREKSAYIIKLCGDPYLKQKDLLSLISTIKIKPHTFYIDDTLIEKKYWGEGWQWDNELNINMPKFNAYNIDDNILSLTISLNKNHTVKITNSANYPVPYINNITLGNTSNITISKDKNNFENILVFNGTINQPAVIKIPIDNLQHYFEFRLKQCLKEKNITIKHSPIQTSDKKIAEITHPLSAMLDDVLKNSNNFISETISKVAAAKVFNKTGSDVDGVNLAKSYCQKIGLDISKIKITDASGVSKNNLLSADFISEYLVKNQNNQTLKHLPIPGEKNLANRLTTLKNYLHAKTGTLSDISNIAGYLTSKSGHKYSFSIMIVDPYSNLADKKSFEDNFLQKLWLYG